MLPGLCRTMGLPRTPLWGPVLTVACKPLTNTLPRPAAALARRNLATSQAAPQLPESAHTRAHSRRQLPDRAGAVLVKKGMTGLYDAEGTLHAVTILQFDRVQVVQCKSRSNDDKYFAVQVGAGLKRPEQVTWPLLGHFTHHNVAPKRWLHEFHVSGPEALLPAGTELTADWFSEGAYVDVKARSTGKGFAGVVKRHGFKGAPASHGHSLSHRSAGSTGQNQTPGRVLPGKKMAGRMGGSYVTVQNVRVMKVDPELGIILVKGSVPGPDRAPVFVRDAIKKYSTPKASLKA